MKNNPLLSSTIIEADNKPLSKTEKQREKRLRLKADRELNPEFYHQEFKVCLQCLKSFCVLNFRVGQNSCISCSSKHDRKKKISFPWKAAWTQAKNRAKHSGREFTITHEDVRAVWTEICPVLLIPLQSNLGKAGPNSHSLDRIDNSKGYIPGNIAVISHRANAIKSDATINELKRLIAYMEGRLLP